MRHHHGSVARPGDRRFNDLQTANGDVVWGDTCAPCECGGHDVLNEAEVEKPRPFSRSFSHGGGDSRLVTSDSPFTTTSASSHRTSGVPPAPGVLRISHFPERGRFATPKKQEREVLHNSFS